MPITLDKPADVPHIAYQAQQAVAPDLGQGSRQPAARPHQHVMRQHVQQHHHLLCLEALLIALGDPQALLVVLERRFDSTAALIIEINIGQQDGVRILQRGVLAGQAQHVRPLQR